MGRLGSVVGRSGRSRENLVSCAKRMASPNDTRSRGCYKTSIAVQLGVMAEKPLLVERKAPGRGQVGRDARTRGHFALQRGESGMRGLQARRRAGKREIEARHHLEQREIR